MESSGRLEIISQIREAVHLLMGLWGHLAVEGMASAFAYYYVFIGLCKGQKKKDASPHLHFSRSHSLTLSDTLVAVHTSLLNILLVLY